MVAVAAHLLPRESLCIVCSEGPGRLWGIFGCCASLMQDTICIHTEFAFKPATRFIKRGIWSCCVFAIRRALCHGGCASGAFCRCKQAAGKIISFATLRYTIGSGYKYDTMTAGWWVQLRLVEGQVCGWSIAGLWAPGEVENRETAPSLAVVLSDMKLERGAFI